MAFRSVIKTLTTPDKRDFKSAIVTSLTTAESSKLTGSVRAAILGCSFLEKQKLFKSLHIQCVRHQNSRKQIQKNNINEIQYQDAQYQY